MSLLDDRCETTTATVWAKALVTRVGFDAYAGTGALGSAFSPGVHDCLPIGLTEPDANRAWERVIGQANTHRLQNGYPDAEVEQAGARDPLRRTARHRGLGP